MWLVVHLKIVKETPDSCLYSLHTHTLDSSPLADPVHQHLH